MPKFKLSLLFQKYILKFIFQDLGKDCDWRFSYDPDFAMLSIHLWHWRWTIFVNLLRPILGHGKAVDRVGKIPDWLDY